MCWVTLLVVEDLQTLHSDTMKQFDILSRSQDDNPSAPIRVHRDKIPCDGAIRRKDGVSLWRSSRGHIYVSIGRLHGNGGGKSPRISVKEKSIWLETSVEDVVP